MTTTVSKKLGDYELIKEIGHGSLGSVFVAEHRFLKRPFVVKIIPEDFTRDRQFILRLEKEAAILAELDHPHIVKVHDVSYADGTYFIVTECIVDDFGETTTLGQYLLSKEDPLPEEEVAKIAKQIASALDYARPIAHLGLKLSNVLIGKGGDGVHVHLSDFGHTKIFGLSYILTRLYQELVRSLAKEGGERAHQTLLQNLSFLAPEQKVCEGFSGKEDVYAFGVLLYYLLMGKVPQGLFEMPSHRLSHNQKGWDHLLVSLLSDDPAKRPISLTQALEKMGLRREGRVPFGVRPVLKPSEIARPEYEDNPAAIFQKELEVTSFIPPEKEGADVEPLLTEMVVVSGGTYFRGSRAGARDEMPRHAVTAPSFAIDIHPVINEQFVRFLEAMGGEKDGNNNDMINLRESRLKRSGGKLRIESGYAKHPVVGVSWYGAMAYAKWVGKRLPTEAEWEIAACSMDEENTYPTGPTLERAQANFFNSDTLAVKSYPPNALGLYDMAGNVYEWCQDWYSYQYYDTSVQEPDNPKGPLQGVYRVLRGGCWKSLKEDLRCAHRHRNNPGTMNRTYGFRLATDVTPASG